MRPHSSPCSSRSKKSRKSLTTRKPRVIQCGSLTRVFTTSVAICPYDRCHAVDKSYLPKHIYRCSRESCIYRKPGNYYNYNGYGYLTKMPAYADLPPLPPDETVFADRRNVFQYLTLRAKDKKEQSRMKEYIRIQLLLNDIDTTDKDKYADRELYREAVMAYMKRLNIQCFDAILENEELHKLLIEDLKMYRPADKSQGIPNINPEPIKKLCENGEGNNIIKQDSSGTNSEHCLVSQLNELELSI